MNDNEENMSSEDNSYTETSSPMPDGGLLLSPDQIQIEPLNFLSSPMNPRKSSTSNNAGFQRRRVQSLHVPQHSSLSVYDEEITQFTPNLRRVNSSSLRRKKSKDKIYLDPLKHVNFEDPNNVPEKQDAFITILKALSKPGRHEQQRMGSMRRADSHQKRRIYAQSSQSAIQTTPEMNRELSDPLDYYYELGARPKNSSYRITKSFEIRDNQSNMELRDPAPRRRDRFHSNASSISTGSFWSNDSDRNNSSNDCEESSKQLRISRHRSYNNNHHHKHSHRHHHSSHHRHLRNAPKQDEKGDSHTGNKSREQKLDRAKSTDSHRRRHSGCHCLKCELKRRRRSERRISINYVPEPHVENTHPKVTETLSDPMMMEEGEELPKQPLIIQHAFLSPLPSIAMEDTMLTHHPPMVQSETTLLHAETIDSGTSSKKSSPEKSDVDERFLHSNSTCAHRYDVDAMSLSSESGIVHDEDISQINPKESHYNYLLHTPGVFPDSLSIEDLNCSLPHQNSLATNPSNEESMEAPQDKGGVHTQNNNDAFSTTGDDTTDKRSEGLRYPTRVPSPIKPSMRDSAYQTKEPSTEKSVSKTNSKTVSKTNSVTLSPPQYYSSYSSHNVQQRLNSKR